mmetsp:Transcript_32092/g.68707  ORF Transcript_32092/g.68707 Transcript_32092/m.68707 type:complete len:218 (-) Transcript_32092:2171-2824(-)
MLLEATLCVSSIFLGVLDAMLEASEANLIVSCLLCSSACSKASRSFVLSSYRPALFVLNSDRSSSLWEERFVCSRDMACTTRPILLNSTHNASVARPLGLSCGLPDFRTISTSSGRASTTLSPNSIFNRVSVKPFTRPSVWRGTSPSCETHSTMSRRPKVARPLRRFQVRGASPSLSHRRQSVSELCMSTCHPSIRIRPPALMFMSCSSKCRSLYKT